MTILRLLKVFYSLMIYIYIYIYIYITFCIVPLKQKEQISSIYSIHPQWLLAFTEADGSFCIAIRDVKDIILGKTVQLSLIIIVFARLLLYFVLIYKIIFYYKKLIINFLVVKDMLKMREVLKVK
nr:putative LAGLIDADG homing endonuclease [Oedogonium sp. 260_circle1_72169]